MTGEISSCQAIQGLIAIRGPVNCWKRTREVATIALQACMCKTSDAGARLHKLTRLRRTPYGSTFWLANAMMQISGAMCPTGLAQKENETPYQLSCRISLHLPIKTCGQCCCIPECNSPSVSGGHFRRSARPARFLVPGLQVLSRQALLCMTLQVTSLRLHVKNKIRLSAARTLSRSTAAAALLNRTRQPGTALQKRRTVHASAMQAEPPKIMDTPPAQKVHIC